MPGRNAGNKTPLYKSFAGEAEVMAWYDKVLSHWPVPHDDSRLDTRFGETFIIASGSRELPPLILLHGACSNAVSWIGEVVTYSRYFRTYSVDIPGDPGRSASNRLSWNSSAYAEWLADVFDGLNIRQSSLLGLSQGGWNALLFAALYPERVRKLVLLSPAGVTSDRASFLARAILYSLLGKRGASALNHYILESNTIDPAAIAYMNVIMTHFKPRIEPLKIFSDSDLERLTMPVLLLGGAHDKIRDVSQISARMKKVLPHLTTHIFPDKGHVLVNTAQEIIPFLLSSPAML
jgi:pimeloyl-ACP methyl ester carboxylesterase